MPREVEVIEEGFEKVVEILKENIAEIDNAIEKEIEEATEVIKAKYASRYNRYTEELQRLVHTEFLSVDEDADNELPVDAIEQPDIEIPQTDEMYI